jgi:hypothetical protein
MTLLPQDFRSKRTSGAPALSWTLKRNRFSVRNGTSTHVMSLIETGKKKVNR